MLGLVKGLVPRAGRDDRQTSTQERHQSCEATQVLGWAEPLEQLCSGETSGGLHKSWDSHPPGYLHCPGEGGPSLLRAQGGGLEVGQSRAWGLSCRLGH